jgi:hypothetical protein
MPKSQIKRYVIAHSALVRQSLIFNHITYQFTVGIRTRSVLPFSLVESGLLFEDVPAQ